MISSHFIKGFFKAWLELKTSFHFRLMKMHKNLLHSPLFFNPSQVREFTNCAETEKKILEPESFGLSNDDCRHQKLLDLLDENGFKPLTVLNDDPGF